MSGYKVAMIGAFDPKYTRHAVIRSGLEKAGCSVTVMALPPHTSTAQRIRHLWRALGALREYDLILIPTFNQMTAPLAWLMIAVGLRKPLLMDYLVGLTDVEEDRQSQNAKSWLYRFIDRFNLHNMQTFTDTASHRAYFANLLQVKTDHMHIIPVGVRDALLETPLETPPSDRFIVQYLGSFIPFHGVEVMLEAASLLHDEPRIQFELIGSGQTAGAMQQRASDLGLENVTFIPGFYQPPDLLQMLSRASAFLGVFGDSPKTRYVIPSKVFENVVLGRPMITAESPALLECFTPGEHLLTVPPGDAAALAEVIRQLAASPDLCQRIGTNGARHIHESLLPQHIGATLERIIAQLLDENVDRRHLQVVSHYAN